MKQVYRGDLFVTGYVEGEGRMAMVVNQNADIERILEKLPLDYAKGVVASQTLEDLIAHEMAHVMLYQECTTDTQYRAKYSQIMSFGGIFDSVSEYAKKNPNEGIAEAFVKVRNGEYVEPIIKVMVKAYFDRYKI